MHIARRGLYRLNPSAPPTGGGTDFFRANEPGGMIPIDQRGFNTLAENASPHNPAWDTDVSLSIATDATAPHSPSNILRAFYPGPPSAFAGGTAPGHAGAPFTGVQDFYLYYSGKYSANWQGHLTGVNKHGYVWCNGLPLYVMEGESVGSAPMFPRMAIQGSPGGAPPTGDDDWYPPNLGTTADKTITRGQWFQMEHYLHGNTSGNHDGTMDFWLNGVHIGSYSGLQFTSGLCKWDTYEWKPIWGGVSDSVTDPAGQTYDGDHVYMSGK